MQYLNEQPKLKQRSGPSLAKSRRRTVFTDYPNDSFRQRRRRASRCWH